VRPSSAGKNWKTSVHRHSTTLWLRLAYKSDWMLAHRGDSAPGSGDSRISVGRVEASVCPIESESGKVRLLVLASKSERVPTQEIF